MQLANSELSPQAKSTLEGQAWVKYYSLEEHLKSECGTDLQPFLDGPDEAVQQTLWTRAFDAMASKIERDRPRHALIALHLVYHRDGFLFSCVDWNRIAALQPTVVVTLIDDIYDCEERLRASGTVAYPSGRFPSWPELLLWRSAEQNAAQQLARNVYIDPSVLAVGQGANLPKKLKCQLRGPIPHLLCGVKHPAATLYRLLFCRSHLPIYTSFPITRTRESTESRDEIDRFRQECHRRFATLDPLALDERRAALEIKEGLEVQVRPTERWPMGVTSMVPGCEGIDVTAMARQIRENLHIIDQHIRWRDYALVDAINAFHGGLIAYRPFWGSDKIAGGVDKELTRAATRNARMFVVDDPSRDKKFGTTRRDVGGPLDMEKIWTAEPTLETLISKHIMPFSQRRIELMKEQETAETWE